MNVLLFLWFQYKDLIHVAIQIIQESCSSTSILVIVLYFVPFSEDYFSYKFAFHIKQALKYIIWNNLSD